jgi:hypothetical protein
VNFWHSLILELVVVVQNRAAEPHLLPSLRFGAPVMDP